jgi:RND family efflux transporter MFP subunit
MPRRLAIALAALLVCAGGSLAIAHGGAHDAHDAHRATPHAPLDRSREALPGHTPVTTPHAAAMVGVVLAERTADVAPPYAGRLRLVNVRLGDHVAEGAVLAALDVATTRYDVPKARAALQSMRIDEQRAAIDLSESKNRLARKQRLYDASLASDEEVESARFQEQGARLRVDGLRAERAGRFAEVERLQQVHAEADVRAPFAGVIAVRYADPGASVSAQTPVVRIVGDGPRFVRFAAPAPASSSLHLGQHVTVHTASGELRATIERIAPEVDGTSRTLAMEATLAPTDAATPVGEMVHVTLDEATP